MSNRTTAVAECSTQMGQGTELLQQGLACGAQGVVVRITLETVTGADSDTRLLPGLLNHLWDGDQESKSVMSTFDLWCLSCTFKFENHWSLSLYKD